MNDLAILKKYLYTFVFVLCVALLGFSSVVAAVTLVYFRTIPGDGQVILLWETATELDNAGFYIKRSDQEDGVYQRINPTIIPPRGDGVTGAVYEYLDPSVINGNIYWYQLESIDFSQQSQFYDPVSAIPGSTPTPTASGVPANTPTATVNQGSTGTSPPPTATPSPAGSLNPTSTLSSTEPNPYPGPSTQTQVPLDLDQATAPVMSAVDEEATATLIPLPSITIQFPKTSTQQPADVVQYAVDEDNATDNQDTPGLTRFWPLGLLGLIWLIIGAWFVVSRRHL